MGVRERERERGGVDREETHYDLLSTSTFVLPFPVGIS